LPGLKLDFLDVHNGTTKADLTLLMMETSDAFSGLVEYSTDLFDASTIGNMFAAFNTLLESIAADPRQPISRLQLTEANQQEVAAASQKPQLQLGCVHELIERQTEETPDAIAISSNVGQLTFRALNARANQVAHYLQGLGIGKGDLVAVCLEREQELM